MTMCCVRKLMGLLVLWVVSSHAVEIPTETSISISTLSNGVEIWLKPHFYPSHSIACRLIAKKPCEDVPQIFTLDCPAEMAEEELPAFIDSCREAMDATYNKVTLVAVGDFDQDGLRRSLSRNCATFSCLQVVPVNSPISIRHSSMADMVYVSLYYPTPFQVLKTEEHLKKLW
jgi:hypothetical protein